MIVHNLVETLPGDNPFKYRIDLREESPEKCAEVYNWAHTTSDFSCTIAGLSIYIRTEESLMMFLLRWS